MAEGLSGQDRGGLVLITKEETRKGGKEGGRGEGRVVEKGGKAGKGGERKEEMRKAVRQATF